MKATIHTLFDTLGLDDQKSNFSWKNADRGKFWANLLNLKILSDKYRLHQFFLVTSIFCTKNFNMDQIVLRISKFFTSNLKINRKRISKCFVKAKRLSELKSENKESIQNFRRK